MKKITIILVCVLTIIIFLVGLLIVHKKTYKIELKEKIFVYELGKKISANVSNYLKDANGTKNIIEYKLSSNDLTIKDDSIVKNDLDIIPVGEYNFKIIYKNKTENFVIKVIDTTAPKFEEFRETIEIEETNENINLQSYFKISDYSNTTLKIEGEYSFENSNQYNLKAIAEDEYGNKTSKNFILNILKKKEVKVDKNQYNSISNGNISNSTTEKTPSNIKTDDIKNNNSPRYRKDISDSYINQINSYRTSKGLSVLNVTNEAQGEADRRAKDISINYSHDGSGYGFGEIIGNGTAGGDFITAWKNSPSHNATILREENTAIAASVYELNGTWYAVVVFRMNY